MGAVTEATTKARGKINCAHCGTKMMQPGRTEHLCGVAVLDWLTDLEETKTGNITDVLKLLSDMGWGHVA